MVHEENDVVFLDLRENIESKIPTRFKDIHPLCFKIQSDSSSITLSKYQM